MIVIKFGGSSVANKEQIDKALAVVRERLDRRPIVISSAHKGMTDALIAAASEAASGTLDPTQPIDMQREIAGSLGCVPALLDEFYTELQNLLRGIRLVREVSPRSQDYVSSFGERMAVRVIADYFKRNGVDARACDAWDCGLVTDSAFGQARPVKGYERAVRQAFEALVAKGEVPIVTGFVSKDLNGDITTVGRNGSDYTATLIGAALGVEEVQVWTDTDGVMTADPSVVSDAMSIPHLSFDEAAEVAFYGGKVLHPSTLLPAIKRNIPVRVLNTNRRDHPGTVIANETTSESGAVTSIVYKENQAVLFITSTRMLGQAGFIARVFEILGRHHVNINMIATSEVNVSMTTDRLANLNNAIRELEPYGKVVVHTNKTILCVVGQNLKQTKGIGARVFQALHEAGVNVEMLSVGANKINFSILIDDADIQRSVTALHEKLFAPE